MEKYAWAAGILEGEGYFGWRTTNCARISCGMTDYDILLRLQELFGGKIYENTKQQDHHKDSWIWVIHGQLAVTVMYIIFPYMGVRRKDKIRLVVAAHDEHKLNMRNKKEYREAIGMTAARDYLKGGKSYRQVALDHQVSFVTIKNYVDKINASIV